MHTTTAPRFRLIRGRRRREDNACAAAMPRIVPWITLGQTRAKMDSGMVSKSVGTTNETRGRGALKQRPRLNNSTTPTNKCIIRTSMTSWTTFCNLSKKAKRTRKSKKSGREPTKMETRSLSRPLVAQSNPVKRQIWQITLSKAHQAREPRASHPITHLLTAINSSISNSQVVLVA